VVAGNQDDYLDPVEPLHHVALMRNTRLVVRYMMCAQPLDRWEYAGVFLTDAEEEVERVFASSEPPTHDAWVKEQLQERSDRVLVNVALRNIKSAAGEYANPAATATEGTGVGLGPISDALGTLLPATDGGAARGGRGGGGGRVGGEEGRGGGRPNGARIVLLQGRHREEEGQRFLDVPFEIRGASRGTVVEAKVKVVVDGGATEDEAPEGAGTPDVLGWKLQGVTRLQEGPRLKVPGGESVNGTLIVSQPPDCAIRVTISKVG
jgi:hypothetical protein